ncbi:PREDICTED: monocarboxylate transporter 13-like [Gekko japonicus]|uniref:Monocarboxylate transporter 13-like n=1 Tax=Gekko japonicus TaxID=146911 RepID=A0ABM1KPZ8_GEKJA|nr:PREDICTED: monocarboxylate transporter 13-like [Gekko japonicus]
MNPHVASSDPPDGGWGWMIALAAFLQTALVFGVVRSFGVFFVEFVVHFGEPSTAVSWISSVTVAVLMFTSPLASALGTQYGERPVGIVGGFLSGLGLFLASFATSLAQLYLFIGLLTGVGGALIFSPSLALVARYFKRRRALANALVFSGTGISALAFSPLFQFLVDSYGWRGALLIVSGMAFHLVVCGALLRPLPLAPNDASGAPGQESRWGRLASLFGLRLLRHRAFMTFCGSGVLITAGYFMPFIHLVPHARETGFDEYQAAFLVSVVGIADIAGRIVAGWLADCGPLRLVHHLTLWTLLTGVTLLLVPLGRNYTSMVAVSIGYGFLASAIIPLKFSTLVEIVGPDQIMGAIGLIHLMESFGALAGPPLSGWIRDATGSYVASFQAAGSILIVGALVLVALPNHLRCLPAASPQDPEDGKEEHDPCPTEDGGFRTEGS